jgi:hypothetical protein
MEHLLSGGAHFARRRVLAGNFVGPGCEEVPEEYTVRIALLHIAAPHSAGN